MPSPARLTLAALTLLSLVTGCDAVRAIDAGGSQDDPAGVAQRCTGCHGDASRPEREPLAKAAPPVGPTGGDGGAHLAHLHGGAFRAGLDCAACHVVPTAPFHSDGKVDVTFGELARAGGAPATVGSGTCAVYCHGVTLDAGGTRTAPRWDEGPLDCQSCHASPPPSHAPGSTQCASCHPGTVKPDGSLDLANGLHIDGVVEVAEQHPAGWSDPAKHGLAAKQDLAGCKACHGVDFNGGTSGVSCNACHGGPAWQSNCTFCHGSKVATYSAADLSRAAPPRGTRGETDPASRAVGAHQAHLAGGPLARPVACAECHSTVPADLSHVNGSAALGWGTLARSGGATPTWNGSTCANYCHGATLNAGGTNKAPRWTGGAAQAACGTCHGAPPPAPHVQDTACGSCHTGYTATSVNPTTHVDGKVDVNAQSCSSCHGLPPSTGQHGRSDHSGRSCGDCHPGYTRTTANASTHRDGSPEVGNKITSWDRATRRCSTTCHGSETW